MSRKASRVALRSKAPILLMGPTGAGKSLLARRIYELKKLKHQIAGPFVEVNCATLKGDGAMSALFGHRKGAFTGAVADRAGLLRAADKDMLFLDEIGELGLDEQAMILRAIEDKCFLPVGADKESSSEFQLIAGTNRDLGEAVSAGAFSDDLYARLNLWTFTLPGLADRREDIAPNLDYELDRFAEREGERASFNKEARQRYLAFATAPDARWPGNFRDLAASVTRMATLSPKGRIDLECVEAEIVRLKRLWSGQTDDGLGILANVLDADALSAIDPFDRVQLAETVRICRTSRSLSEAVAPCSRRRALAGAPPTTRIGCVNISPGSDWTGRQFHRSSGRQSAAVPTANIVDRRPASVALATPLNIQWHEARQSTCLRCSKMFGCGCSSMAEQKLPKLTTRVRFPSPAPSKTGNPWLFEFSAADSVDQERRGQLGGNHSHLGVSAALRRQRSQVRILSGAPQIIAKSRVTLL